VDKIECEASHPCLLMVRLCSAQLLCEPWRRHPPHPRRHRPLPRRRRPAHPVSTPPAPAARAEFSQLHGLSACLCTSRCTAAFQSHPDRVLLEVRDHGIAPVNRMDREGPILEQLRRLTAVSEHQLQRE
jgi:hypothetical protein